MPDSVLSLYFEKKNCGNWNFSLTSADSSIILWVIVNFKDVLIIFNELNEKHEPLELRVQHGGEANVLLQLSDQLVPLAVKTKPETTRTQRRRLVSAVQKQIDADSSSWTPHNLQQLRRSTASVQTDVSLLHIFI